MWSYWDLWFCAVAVADHDGDLDATGLFTVMEENLKVPFETRVLGVSVTVTGVDLTDGIQIVATCCRDGLRQAIPILDLPLPTPPPAGTDWIDAYRRWLG